MAAIVAVDVVGYSRLAEEDEAGTLANLHSFRVDVIDSLLSKHAGRLVKLMGDGALAEFASVVEAVNFAVELQLRTAAQQAALPEGRRFALRIGVNLGDVVVDGDDLLGDGVNVAARLEQICDPSGIFVSGTVFDHLTGKIDVPLEFIGEQHVKNIARPIRTYRVLYDGKRARRPTRRMSARTVMLVGAAAVVVTLLLGGWWLLAGRTGTSDPHSIAVLAFENLSGDPNDVWIAEGFGEDIITQLARNRELTVLARSSSMSLEGADRAPVAAARILGVRYVLDGSVRRLGDSVRLTVRLVDGPRNVTIWNENYDIGADALVRTQDEIVDRIAGTLFSEVRVSEKAQSLRKPPKSFDVFDLSVRGLALKHQLNADAFREGRALLQRAIELDPNYAPAFAYLGLLDAIDVASGFTGPKTAADMDTAIALMRRAIELDPTFAYAWQALGYSLCLKGDCTEGLRALDRAVDLGPSDADNQLFYGFALASNGRFEEAVAAGERAFELNPLTPLYYYGIQGRTLYGAGRNDEAVTITQPCIDRQFYQRSCRLARIAALVELGRENEARAELADFLGKAPGFTQENAVKAAGFPVAPKTNERFLRALAVARLPPA